MTATLTASYKEFLTADTVEKIDELLEENHDLDDMLEFIDERNETNFINYYEEYVRCGEAIGYDAVDALMDENGECSCIENCDEMFRGWYASEAEFAEEHYTEKYDIPCEIVVDWQATWDCNLRHDFTACEKSYRKVAIFSDY